MIPGGIADKLGNRYEAKWLVRVFIDVISGKANWLNFESVDTAYQGFEFAVGRGKNTEWHQTKVNSPFGNWTINALNKEGVLTAFSNRLSSDDKSSCFFVSQDNAKDFRMLTEKARTANSPDQFFDILSIDQINQFNLLKKNWDQADAVVFNWLNRSNVVIIPERELDGFIESYGDLYFEKGGKTVFPNIRDLLEKYFNKNLTKEKALSAIKINGNLKFKYWAFDQTIIQRLDEETDAYLQTYTPFGSGGVTIFRDQTVTIVDKIINPEGPNLVLVTGVAGSGKSGIVRGVIKKLREKKVPHLAFRVDHYLSCDSKEGLGKILTGREESPVSTLKGTFPEKTSILFVDQVDAVSEVSGRDGRVKEVIFRLITDAKNFGGVKIVIVCRTFDLNSDSRLKSLIETNQTEQIDVPLFDWKVDVEPLLYKKGYDISILKEPQRQLLCLPINLSVYLEIDDTDFNFLSRSNLHEKLIVKKQRIISRERNLPWSLIKPLSAMCDWMSQRQALSAPVSVLDDYLNAVDILTSEGLIVSSRGQINFFHESFFDHIYARSFVTIDESLIDLLISTEQHLFRRTQVRQILEALRQNDFDRYITELSSVLFSNYIRFHIKTAICHWLSSIEKPSGQEFEILCGIDNKDGKFHQLFLSAVFSTHAWFDLLNENDWIRSQLYGEDEERVETVLWWLHNIAGERPVEIAILIRSWWEGNQERTERLLNWFGFVRRKKPDDDLFNLCCEIIETKPTCLFRERGFRSVEMLLHTWLKLPFERTGRLLHSLFDAWFSLNPDDNPLEREEIRSLNTDSISTLSTKAPKAFLEGTTDAIIRSIEMVVAEGKKGSNFYSFAYRTHSGDRFGFDQFLGLYRSTLKKLAIDDPKTAALFIEKLDPNKHQCMVHLHLETIKANPMVFGKLLPSLITNEMVFDSGYNGADWLSLAQACREAFQHLNVSERKVIEQEILKHTPEIDFAIRIAKEIYQNGE